VHHNTTGACAVVLHGGLVCGPLDAHPLVRSSGSVDLERNWLMRRLS
jgi:hypothetical protein